jgi:hypothetical protein
MSTQVVGGLQALAVAHFSEFFYPFSLLQSDVNVEFEDSADRRHFLVENLKSPESSLSAARFISLYHVVAEVGTSIAIPDTATD